MLELKIFSPQESGFVPEIKWNNEEHEGSIAREDERVQRNWSYRRDYF